MKRKDIIKSGFDKYYKVGFKMCDDNLWNVNFDYLLVYIGDNLPCKDKNSIASAYYRIKMKTNELLCLSKRNMILKTSNKEIAAIRFYYDVNCINYSVFAQTNSNVITKIPYKIEYIFKAIDLLLNEIEKNNSTKLPSKIEHLKGQRYGKAFYQTQINAYNAIYNQISSNNKIAKSLKDDFTSHDSSLNKTLK